MPPIRGGGGGRADTGPSYRQTDITTSGLKQAGSGKIYEFRFGEGPIRQDLNVL